MKEFANKAAFGRFTDAVNSGDRELISKTIDQVVEPNALIRTPLPSAAAGAALLKEVFGRLHQAFPDLHVTIEDMIAEGEKVVARNTVTGTHQGEYMGVAPTGTFISYNEVFICRFANGKIAETWGIVDVLSQLRQLGALPGGPL
jgi:steroid delta-isomerase-like uncharacterized protein